MKLPREEYARIIETMPILCVDIVIRNAEGRYLLIQRANEPLKGVWWVIGGRVWKGETLVEAASRKAREEVGLEISSFTLLGYYEALEETNPMGYPHPQHAISVVFSTSVRGDEPIELDSQSSAWRYSERLPEDFVIRSGRLTHRNGSRSAGGADGREIE